MTFPRDTIEYFEPKEYSDGLFTQIIAILLRISVVINGIFSVAILAFWFMYGRDSKDNRAIVRMYDPPKGDDGSELSP